MMTNLLFSQASALGKRLAMVLTMLLIVGIGQAWGETVADEITFGNPGDKNNYEAIKLTKEGTFTDHNNFIWSCSSDAAISNGGGALSACYSYAGNKNTSSSYIEISWTADKDYNVTQFDLNAYANGDNPLIILTIDEQVSTITAPKSKGTTFYSFSTNNFLVQLQKGKKITARIQKDASKAVTGIVALKYTFVECTAETSYFVTSDLSNVTSDPANPTSVLESAEELTLAYLPEDGWNLPATISVTMGGTPLSSETDYDWDNGDLLIAPASGFTGNIVVTINGWQQLATPTGLNVADITSSGATLSWSAVANASSYNVVVSDGLSSDIVKEGIVATSIEITGLSPDTEYSFTVIAIGSGSYQDSDEASSDIFKTNPVYTVSYDYNGSNVAGNPPSDENKYEKGDEITILSKESEIAKEGCYFAGWSTQENGTGTLYQAGDTYTIQDNTIFYAQWVECSEENTPNISIENDNSNNVTVLWNEIAGATSYSVYLLDEESQAYTYNNIISTSKIINIDEIGTAGEYILDVTPYKGNAQIGCGGVAVIVLTENPTYIITIADNIQNGTVTADKSDAAEGEIVTLTATPNTGYAFGSWTVTDASSNTITVTSNTFTMPASNVTVSATFEALPTYSIQWLVNSEKAKGTPTTSVIEGQQISNLPTTPTSADCDGVKEFVGWTDEEIIGISATAPTNLYIELEDFPAITKEKIFYAVFANVEGAGSGNYEKLTADLSDWSGEYLIVYEDESVAFNGGLTSLDVASNYISVEIKDNEIERDETTMKACLFVTAVDGGYAIQSASGYFIGHPKGVNSNKLYYNSESIYVNTFEDYNTIKGESAYEIAYNADAGQKRFRYYNSANVEDVALYKKSSYTNYTTSCVTYTVTWKNYDGTIIETDENVWYGTIPTYNGVLPTKPATDQYNYIFAGWTPEVTSVTGDATYTATFSENVNIYTITFQNYDGSELQTSSVEYGITPTYDGDEPTKAADAQYTYTFEGWTPDIVKATADATYTATYTETVNKYTITWKNEDGTVLETDNNVPYGETPTYNGTTPAKAATAQYTYTFNGWSPEVTTVTGDATYSATFSETVNKYQVTFNMNGHGDEITAQTVDYGSTAAEPSPAPTADDYKFAGWYKDEACTEAYDFSSTITGDLPLYAKWLNIYTITWKANGLEYTTTEVTEGEPITPPASSPDAGDYCGQVFVGWTTAEMGETTNVAPTLYPNPTPFPTASEEAPKTFYAVFADYDEQQ